MKVTVLDVIRNLYSACEGNLQMEVEGIALTGGEAILTGHKYGTLFGTMNIGIDVKEDEDLYGNPCKKMVLNRGGISDFSVREGSKELNVSLLI